MSNDSLVFKSIPYVGVALMLVLSLAYAVYSGKPIDTSDNCKGDHGPCKGSITAKARALLGVP